MRKTTRYSRFTWISAAGFLAALAVSRCSAAVLPALQLDFNNPDAANQVLLNGDAGMVFVDGQHRLRMTDDLNQRASVWLQRPYRLPAYTIEFDFEVRRTDPRDQPADGFTFAAQQYGPVALGDAGNGLGYTRIPGYSYAVEFNTNAPQGLPDRPETIGLDIIGVRVKIGQVAFPHIDRGVFHALVTVRREGLDVMVSGGRDQLPPTRVFTSPWWIQFDNSQPMWLGFTAGTGGQRSTIDLLKLKVTPLQ